MSKLDGFNRIAHGYDFLKRLVFGSAILKSEYCFLRALPASGNVLILGGGSGEILRPLLRDCPGVRVWYVEASSVMLQRSRRNVSLDNLPRVEFIHGTEAAIPPGILFDAVVTHFFLDLFSDAHLRRLCERVHDQMNNGGVWLVSDFVNSGKAWHRLLLWLMYRFFGATSGVDARVLPHWEDAFLTCAKKPVASATFYNGFIRSSLYMKRSQDGVNP